MSELKATTIHNAYWKAASNGDNSILVYIKSEADKVIAELKDKALQYKVLYKELCRDINTQERHFALQVNYQKFKRCLAMAKMCRARYDEEDAKVNDGISWEFISPEMKYWERWSWRWEALADKVKEAK